MRTACQEMKHRNDVYSWSREREYRNDAIDILAGIT